MVSALTREGLQPLLYAIQDEVDRQARDIQSALTEKAALEAQAGSQGEAV